MCPQGSIEGIYIAPDAGEPMESVDSIEAVAGRGLRGDRYFHEQGIYDRSEDLPPGSDVTFIEMEALEAAQRDADVSLDPSEARRNVVTRDVPLNHLVDREFSIGDVTLVGDELCEPCHYLESLLDRQGIVAAFTHRGGLNATIQNSGMISSGDKIQF